MKYLRSERLETNSSFSQKASRANDEASQFSLRGFVFILVREVGLEPTRHCCRQDLNLVRLPISPLTRVFAASLKRVLIGREPAGRALCPTVSYCALKTSGNHVSRQRIHVRRAKPGILTESMAIVCKGRRGPNAPGRGNRAVTELDIGRMGSAPNVRIAEQERPAYN